MLGYGFDITAIATCSARADVACFEDCDAEVGVIQEKLAGNAAACDSRPDDDNVDFLGKFGGLDGGD